MKLPESVMLERQRAYADAARIEEVINDTIKVRDIVNYPDYWLTFCRTLKTGLDIIEAVAMEEIKK